jgi:hypothetical protein
MVVVDVVSTSNNINDNDDDDDDDDDNNNNNNNNNQWLMWLLWMLSLLPTTTQVRQRVQLMMNRGISITDEVCVKLSIPPPGVDASEVHA